MNRIALHGREVSEDVGEHLSLVVKILRQRGVEVLVTPAFKNSKYAPILGGFDPLKNESLPNLDCFLSLGGDGTFLETLTYVGKFETPILGINTGRMGFLAAINKKDIQTALDMMFEKAYQVEPRTMVELVAPDDLFEGQTYGLNELAILRKDSGSMIKVVCYLDNQYLSSYWSDGIMVVTPTGSTGYSLSCGGPIIIPQSANFVLTPVSPHNLNVRPFVIPDSSEIKFEIESRSNNFLVSLDSRYTTAKTDLTITVRKAPYVAKLIRIDGQHFIKTLRSKLSWGLDGRS